MYILQVLCIFNLVCRGVYVTLKMHARKHTCIVRYLWAYVCVLHYIVAAAELAQSVQLRMTRLKNRNNLKLMNRLLFPWIFESTQWRAATSVASAKCHEESTVNSTPIRGHTLRSMSIATNENVIATTNHFVIAEAAEVFPSNTTIAIKTETEGRPTVRSHKQQPPQASKPRLQQQ